MKTVKKILITFGACLILVASPADVLAQEEPIDHGVDIPNQADGYTEHEIDYYTNSTALCRPGSAASISSDPVSNEGGLKNEDYAGNQIWSEEELELIDRHKPVYMEAAQEENVPWAMLAVIHKRENNLRLTYNSNRQGIYQFYEQRGTFPASGTASPEQFLEETQELARQLQEDYVTRNHPSNGGQLSSGGTADNVIQDTFFSYNGRADVYIKQAGELGFNNGETEKDEGGGFEGSPYVMNRADAERDPNVSPDTWGQVKTDGGDIDYPANQDYGAWVYYAALAGIGGGCSHGSGPTKQLEIDGVMYAWPIAPGQKKADHEGLLSDLPCPNPRGCHYGVESNNPAFDITRAPGGNAAVGTEVYAITDGQLMNVRPSYNGEEGCQSFQLVSVDGYKYWYGHIKEVPASSGQEVTVGQPLGVLGESRCSAPNYQAPPHLHIDRGSPMGEPGGGQGAGDRDEGFVTIINALFEVLD